MSCTGRNRSVFDTERQVGLRRQACRAAGSSDESCRPQTEQAGARSGRDQLSEIRDPSAPRQFGYSFLVLLAALLGLLPDAATSMPSGGSRSSYAVQQVSSGWKRTEFRDQWNGCRRPLSTVAPNHRHSSGTMPEPRLQAAPARVRSSPHEPRDRTAQFGPASPTSRTSRQLRGNLTVVDRLDRQGDGVTASPCATGRFEALDLRLGDPKHPGQHFSHTSNAALGRVLEWDGGRGTFSVLDGARKKGASKMLPQVPKTASARGLRTVDLPLEAVHDSYKRIDAANSSTDIEMQR